MREKIVKLIIRLLPVLVLLAVVPAAVKLVTPQSFTFHDETQIADLHQFVETMSLGQFPPRWALDMHFTYGSPYPEFNYQLPYYLGFIFNKIGFSLFKSYVLCLALSLFVGALGMYYFAKNVTSPLASFAAAVLYTYTPYRAVDAFVRGTVGESFALAIFPWIFLCLYKLKQKQDIKIILLTAISVASLILSHQPSTAFGLPIIVGIFFVVELIHKNFQFIKGLFVSLFISLGLSAYYLIPVLLEKSFIQEVLPYNFYDHFPFIWQLIYSRWGYGASNWGPYDDMSFQVGIVNLILILVGVIILFIKTKKEKKSEKNYLFASLSAIALVLFLMNVRSSFFWKIYPFTNAIQFPWRLLSMTTILTTTLFVYISKLVSTKVLKIFSFIVIIASFSLTISYFHPGEITNSTDAHFLRRYLPNQELLPGETVSTEYLQYTENYIPLPTNAVRPTSMPTSKITALPDTQIYITRDNPFDTQATVTAPTNEFVTINTFYYPGWNITVDNKPVEVTLDKYGAMRVFLTSGEHSLGIQYKDTPVRLFSNIISLIAWTFIVTFFIKQITLIPRGKRR